VGPALPLAPRTLMVWTHFGRTWCTPRGLSARAMLPSLRPAHNMVDASKDVLAMRWAWVDHGTGRPIGGRRRAFGRRASGAEARLRQNRATASSFVNAGSQNPAPPSSGR
jgi:hypothetical protein